MNMQVLILLGVVTGLFVWSLMPRWRRALRFAPVVALTVSVLSAFVSLQLPNFVPPVLSGVGATVAVLQVMKGGGRR
jgi:uncharacterized membrane protein YbhN (UPF0104 family)